MTVKNVKLCELTPGKLFCFQPHHKPRNVWVVHGSITRQFGANMIPVRQLSDICAAEITLVNPLLEVTPLRPLPYSQAIKQWGDVAYKLDLERGLVALFDKKWVPCNEYAWDYLLGKREAATISVPVQHAIREALKVELKPNGQHAVHVSILTAPGELDPRSKPFKVVIASKESDGKWGWSLFRDYYIQSALKDWTIKMLESGDFKLDTWYRFDFVQELDTVSFTIARDATSGKWASVESGRPTNHPGGSEAAD